LKEKKKPSLQETSLVQLVMPLKEGMHYSTKKTVLNVMQCKLTIHCFYRIKSSLDLMTSLRKRHLTRYLVKDKHTVCLGFLNNGESLNQKL